MVPGNINKPPAGGASERDKGRKRRGKGTSVPETIDAEFQDIPRLEGTDEMPRLEDHRPKLPLLEDHSGGENFSDADGGLENARGAMTAEEQEEVDGIMEKLGISTPAGVNGEEAGEDQRSSDSDPVAALEPETLAERRDVLSNTVKAHSDIATEKKVAANESDRLSRTEKREKEAAAFAERTGLSDIRNVMIEAENTFKAARKKNVLGLIGIESDEFRTAKVNYLQAVSVWRNGINAKIDSLDEQERVRASIIRQRDTVLRVGMLNTDTKFELLSGTDKRLALQLLGKGAYYLNKPFAALGELAAGDLTGDARKRYAQRASQFARILAGAVAGGALATATAPAAVPLTFFLLAGRGVLASTAAVSVGAFAASIGGGVYEKVFRKGSAEKTRNLLKALQADDSAENLEKAQRAIRSNFLSRKKTKSSIQLGSAFLGGFLAGRGTGMLFDASLDHLSNASVVSEAKQAVATPTFQDESKSLSGDLRAHGAQIEKELGATPTTPQVPWHEAPGTLYSETVTIGKGEGADALFNKLQIELRTTYPNPEDAPPAIKELLEKSPNQLSREYGFAKGDWSRVMHEGDSLTMAKDGTLTFSSGTEAVSLTDSPLPIPESKGIPADATSETERVSYTPTPEPLVVETNENIKELTVDTNGIEQNNIEASIEAEKQKILDTKQETLTVDPASQAQESINAEYRSPLDIPGEPRTPFTNSYGVTVNPEVTTLFKDQRGNVFVYGGTYEQQRLEAIQYAKQNPGVLVHFEGKPFENGDSFNRWTSTAISNGTDVIAPTEPLSKGQVGQVPDPMRFVSVLGKRGV